MKKIPIIFLALAFAAACSREAVRPDTHDATLTLEFETGGVSTRAVTPGDGVVADGGGIAFDETAPDLVILVADSSGEIESRYPFASPANGKIEADPADKTRMQVTFKGLSAGNHTVYAFANTKGLWNMVSPDLTSLTTLTTKTQVEALQFAPIDFPAGYDNLDGTEAKNVNPALLQERLPLSATGSVSLSSGGNGEMSLEMIRCVAKVTFRFVNQTGEALTLKNCAFAVTNLCPDRAFVLPGFGIPDGTVYGSIVQPKDAEITIENGSVMERSFLTFPGFSPEGYVNSARFTVGEKEYSYSGLYIHDYQDRKIVSLERNQHLHVVTAISKGLKVSFNFEVQPWETKVEEVQFD